MCWRACIPALGVWRARRSWLRDVIDEFIEHLNTQRFKMSTLRVCCRRLLGFGEFTATRGVRQVAALPQWIDPYVAQLRARDASRHTACLILRRFIGFLQEKEVVPDPEPVHPPAPHARLIDDYLLYLRERRGLCPETLELVRAPCIALMDSVATEGIRRPQLDPTRSRHPFHHPRGRTLQPRDLAGPVFPAAWLPVLPLPSRSRLGGSVRRGGSTSGLPG